MIVRENNNSNVNDNDGEHSQRFYNIWKGIIAFLLQLLCPRKLWKVQPTRSQLTLISIKVSQNVGRILVVLDVNRRKAHRGVYNSTVSTLKFRKMRIDIYNGVTI